MENSNNENPSIIIPLYLKNGNIRIKNSPNSEIFYVINPMFIPIPLYTHLICIEEEGGEAIDIKINYDPFSNDEKCLYFITWTSPTPYTTPLFFYKEKDRIIASFSKRDKPYLVIHVLTPYRKANTIKGKNWFQIINGKPIFSFKNYMGRCIPDPNGIPFQDCTLQHDLNFVKPSTLLESIKKRSRKIRIPLFTYMGIISFLVLFGILIFLIFRDYI